ncbi:TIGR00341 family protein [Kordiimonas aestuarii]|uniref:TIGR00341 family protein n=1 Tax=Kordiimonas aestuarii TaxID=1005925 RepID=UPI0021D2C1FF|nr:TIGR00341 family protein [Kordiimonas aestuarii]
MPLKMLQVAAPVSVEANIRKIASGHECVISYHKGVLLDDDHALFFLLTKSGDRQQVIDALQQLLGTSSRARITILPVETTLPHVEMGGSTDTREELYYKMGQGARLDLNYLILTFLSTIVALIGLMQNNVAVVIGAMVIAPLLGPNLAFAFGTSLGDKEMMTQAFMTAIGGISLAVFVSAVIGFSWHELPDSHELMSRTEVDLSGIALAAASGVAGVLSLTSGLSMTLVGVMVAVALLPPAATFGFMLGRGEYLLAYGALLLLVVNVVCVNLSGLLVFLAKGIKPRLWFERRMATPYVLGGIAVWAVLLIMLIFVIDLRSLS